MNPYIFNYDQDLFFRKVLSNLFKYPSGDYPTYHELMNSELHRFRNKPLIEIMKDEYMNVDDEDFSTIGGKSSSSIKRLYGGKITREMVGIFMIELTRTYLRALKDGTINTTLDTDSEHPFGWRK